MKRALVYSALGLCLLGQGCFSMPAIGPAQTVQTSPGQPSPEGLVAFRKGFGLLPGRAPSSSRSVPNATTTWSVEIPALPNEVTVLRQHASAPDTVLLQNITSALRIPAGILGGTPTADGLTLGWHDAEKTEFAWEYGANLNRISFRCLTPADALTVREAVKDERLIESAKLFLSERGVETDGWGKPEITYSWSAWWDRMQNEDRCMDGAALDFMRRLGANGAADARIAPWLPKRDKNVRCLSTEFPALQPVSFSATRDGQVLLDGNAVPIPTAMIAINLRNLAVQGGWFELSRDLDRSNYPSLTAEEVAKRLREGGLNPLNATSTVASVNIEAFSIELYRHDVAVNGTSRSFFIPALWALGKITYVNGGTANYATVVPLVKDEEYSSR